MYFERAHRRPPAAHYPPPSGGGVRTNAGGGVRTNAGGGDRSVAVEAHPDNQMSAESSSSRPGLEQKLNATERELIEASDPGSASRQRFTSAEMQEKFVFKDTVPSPRYIDPSSILAADDLPPGTPNPYNPSTEFNLWKAHAEKTGMAVNWVSGLGGSIADGLVFENGQAKHPNWGYLGDIRHQAFRKINAYLAVGAFLADMNELLLRSIDAGASKSELQDLHRFMFTDHAPQSYKNDYEGGADDVRFWYASFLGGSLEAFHGNDNASEKRALEGSSSKQSVLSARHQAQAYIQNENIPDEPSSMAVYEAAAEEFDAIWDANFEDMASDLSVDEHAQMLDRKRDARVRFIEARTNGVAMVHREENER